MSPPPGITVAPRSRNDPPYSTRFVLAQNNWDDFGFKTTYALFYSGDTFTGLIGRLKLMRRGQETGNVNLLPVGPLAPLSDEWVSLGESLDYYERIASLPRDDREAILLALRDAMREPDHAAILPPRIETYGESIGEVADVVFGLNPNATDYHKTLSRC